LIKLRDTRSIGIRLPIALWDMVKIANPDLTYSEIVKGALEEKYSFISSKFSDIELEVDRILKEKGVG